jgi:glycosyltransferase involved in cell wall biosynthesis
VIFLGGMSRSGTTLLERMLGELPGFTPVGELMFIWERGVLADELCACGQQFSRCEFWQRVGAGGFGGWDPRRARHVESLRAEVDRQRHIPALATGRGGRRSRDRLRALTAELDRLYRAVAAEAPDTILVDSSKNASYAYLLRSVEGVDLRVIHVVRDARGVAFSMSKRVVRPEVTARVEYMTSWGSLATSAHWASQNTFLEAMPRFGVPTIRVRYEDLVRDPLATLSRIAAFAGVRPDEDGLSFLGRDRVRLGPTHSVAGNPLRFRTGEIPLGLDEAWRRDMRASQRRVVSALTGPWLFRYGYLGPTMTAPLDDSKPPAIGEWPSVTVVIPTRDRPELLRRAVRSVVGQRYGGPIECVVVVDGPMPVDPGVEAGPGVEIRSIVNDRAPGLAGTRNTGILDAGGELVAFLDDDDEWLPDKLRLQVEALLGCPEAVIAGGGIELRYGGRTTVRVPPRKIVRLPDLLRSRMMELHSSNLLARRADLSGRVGLVDETLPSGQAEDYELLLRAARLGSIVVVPQPTARIHWHEDSFFRNSSESLADALEELLRRYPEFRTDGRALARLTGQIAFYRAASGRRSEAARWARLSMRARPLERRAWLALGVAAGMVRADTMLRMAHRAGRGI